MCPFAHGLAGFDPSIPAPVSGADEVDMPPEVTEAQAFEIFDRIARVLIATTDLKAALASLMDEAVALTGAEYGGYFYNDRDKHGEDAWELFALSGADEVLFRPLGKPRITPLFFPTYTGSRVIRSDDVYADPRYGALGGLPTGHIALRSYLAVPVLRADGRVHGAMLFGHSKVGRFSPRIEGIVASIASLSQVALERSQHIMRLEHEVRERQRAEKRFSDLIEHSPRMKWWRSAEPGTETTFFNRVWRDFTGLENAPGLLWTALIHPDEREYITTMRAQQMANGMSYGGEFRLRGHDGRYRWLSALVSPIRDIEGRITDWVGTATDITDRREAEARLSANNRLLNEIINASPDPIFVKDPEGRHLVINTATAVAMGIPIEAIIGKTLHELCPAPYADRMRAGDLVALGGGSITHEETVPRAGIDTLYESRKTPLRNERGEIVGVVGVARDITERMRQNEALRMSERRLKATQDSAGVGICEIDRHGEYLTVNETFTTMSGYAIEDLRGKTVLDLIEDPADRADSAAKLAQLVKGEIESFEVARCYRSPEGRQWWADCRMTAVTDENGRFLYAVRVVQDITKARKAQDQERLLLAELTHRVKNTIATIQSLATQTLRTAVNPAEFSESFHGRLHAIAATHSLLIQTNWTGATLGDVLSLELAPYHLGKSRFMLTGPEVHLNPSAAVNMGLVLHELITNAVKYGALSAHGTGSLAVTWDVVPGENPGDDDRLLLNWSERGGPPVTAPKRKGFGTRLFRSIASQFMGVVDIDYDPAGVQAVIDIPMTTIKVFAVDGPREY